MKDQIHSIAQEMDLESYVLTRMRSVYVLPDGRKSTLSDHGLLLSEDTDEYIRQSLQPLTTP